MSDGSDVLQGMGQDGEMYGAQMPGAPQKSDPRDDMMKRFMQYRQMFAGGGMPGMGGGSQGPTSGGGFMGGLGGGLSSGMGSALQALQMKQLMAGGG